MGSVPGGTSWSCDSCTRSKEPRAQKPPARTGPTAFSNTRRTGLAGRSVWSGKQHQQSVIADAAEGLRAVHATLFTGYIFHSFKPSIPTMQLHSLFSCQARHHRPKGRGKVFTPVTDRSLRRGSVIHRRPTRGRCLLADRQGRGPVDIALRTGIASFFVSSVATGLRLGQGGTKPSHRSRPR